MSRRYILNEYVHEAFGQAVYDKLGDETFAGSIPGCPGVVALAPTLYRCERELRSTLEDWILLGLKLAHPLPVIGGIDLTRNRRVSRWVPCKRADFETGLQRRTITLDTWTRLS